METLVSKPTGGNIFPFSSSYGSYTPNLGVTLRDWVALEAAKIMLANRTSGDIHAAAFRFADSFIKARDAS